MSFFKEFPHTHTYDTDLAWLIKRMKELLEKVDKIDELMAELKKIIADLPETIQERINITLQEMIENGTFNEIFALLTAQKISLLNYQLLTHTGLTEEITVPCTCNSNSNTINANFTIYRKNDSVFAVTRSFEGGGTLNQMGSWTFSQDGWALLLEKMKSLLIQNLFSNFNEILGTPLTESFMPDNNFYTNYLDKIYIGNEVNSYLVSKYNSYGRSFYCRALTQQTTYLSDTLFIERGIIYPNNMQPQPPYIFS